MTTAERPVVSVIMASHNAGTFIENLGQSMVDRGQLS